MTSQFLSFAYMSKFTFSVDFSWFNFSDMGAKEHFNFIFMPVGGKKSKA